MLDPLTAPDPSDETGPGTHFGSTYANLPQSPQQSGSKSSETSRNPFRKSGSVTTTTKNASSSSQREVYPSPPQSVSPRKERFAQAPHRQQAFDSYAEAPVKQRGTSNRKSADLTGAPVSLPNRARRSSSLKERYAGDISHRPLDQIKHETKLASRAPHLRKKHHIGPDTIDSLDASGGGAYHHSGPYDATLLARNTSYANSPVEAVSGTTEETLKATPREKVVDSISRHRPLDGVASVPSGERDRYGKLYTYEEGSDMMREGRPEGGAYKRWDGIVSTFLQ